MSKKKPLTRITITLPAPLVAAADRRARELDRSRSWVLAEALKTWLEAKSPAPPQVREAAGSPYAWATSPGLGEYRLDQLKADLALTPEQRVRAAEETARVSRVVRPPLRGKRVLFFERFEDYLDWKRREEVAG